MNMAGLPSESY